MRINLSSGAWADIRSHTELRAGDRLAYQTPIGFDVAASDEQVEAAMHMSMATIQEQQMRVFAAVLDAWSYPWPPESEDPRDPIAHVRVIPLHDWDELAEAIEPHIEKLRKSGPKDRTPDAARKATTTPSRSSSRARPHVIQAASIPSPSSGSSTSSATG